MDYELKAEAFVYGAVGSAVFELSVYLSQFTKGGGHPPKYNSKYFVYGKIGFCILAGVGISSFASPIYGSQIYFFAGLSLLSLAGKHIEKISQSIADMATGAADEDKAK